MKEKNILKNIFSANKLKIYNIIIILISILIFEFGYCNHTVTEKLLQGEITTFYFSICRGIFYIAILIATVVINKKFDFKQIEDTYDNKLKRILIFAYIIIAILAVGKILFDVKIVQDATILMTQVSMLLLTIIGGFVTVIYISSNFTANIVSMLILASVLSVTCTTYNVLDEKKHFMESYNISYLNLNFSNPVVDKQFMEEIPRGTNYIKMADYYQVPYVYEQGQIPENDEPDSTPAGTNPIVYIPSALGITVARVLKGSVADVFLLGRFFNLIVYAALIILTLKILPFKKNIFFVIAIAPMLLTLAGTYSPDGLGMAFISLFIAYCLKLYDKKEDINIKEVIILAILYCLTLTFKSMSYFAIGLIVFILPIIKTIKYNKKKLLWLIPVLAVFMIIMLLVQPTVDITQGDSRGGDTGTIPQLQNLLENPSLILSVVCNHITLSLLNFDWIKDLNFNYYFGDISKQIFLCMIIFYFYAAIKDDSKNFNKKNKAIFISTFLAIFAITSAALYFTFTEIGYGTVVGYQARYLFPIIFLLLMCVSNKNIKNNEPKENQILKLGFIANLFIIISAIGAIIYNI